MLSEKFSRPQSRYFFDRSIFVVIAPVFAAQREREQVYENVLRTNGIPDERSKIEKSGSTIFVSSRRLLSLMSKKSPVEYPSFTVCINMDREITGAVGNMTGWPNEQYKKYTAFPFEPLRTVNDGFCW